jgi:RimJ/RimL family protein N-acetyltransferase
MMPSMTDPHRDEPRSIEPFGPADTRPAARTEPPFTPGPVTLHGRVVQLAPLSLDHVPALAEVALDPAVWRWTRDQPTSEAELRDYVERALAVAATGREVPFVQLERATGRPIGSTRFLNISPDDRRLEIGYTWLGRRFWGHGRNPDAKRTLLAHAFDDLGAHRVEFKTDALNGRSRAALRAIGATEEGVFRRHALTSGGRVRDSAYYSVIWEEWPRVRDHLDALIERLLGAATAT